jgi:predicted aldo/keto reductase-like oxidoreductase
MGKVEEIFEEQLKKCQVEYFDFYLFHNVCEMNIDAYLDPKYGIYEYLMKQKENGRIRHLGFSAHGSYSVIKHFLEAYGKDMEFGQLQINYLDWKFQNAKEKVELLQEYNIPIWVMEPLRGGRLVSLPQQHEEKLKALRPDENATAWAFRFLQSIPGVNMILSGMSNFEQMVENIRTFEEDKPLKEEEMNTLLAIADEMLTKKILPCTACRYCTSHCPMNLEIPDLLGLYNEHIFTGGGFIAPMALMAYDEDKKPSACIGCRSCEQVCPQQIKISEAMVEFAKSLGM